MSDETSLDICWGEFGDVGLFEGLDDFIQSFVDPVNVDLKPETDVDVAVSSMANAADDAFEWEDMKLADAEYFADVGKFEPVEPKPATSVPVLYDSPSPASTLSADECAATDRSTSNALLSAYGLTDKELCDINLKHLQSLCKNNNDYHQLKSYRRTCLNRYYARSSRNKQQVKTTSLAQKLEQSKQDVTRLQRENDMKDATIRCLQLELQILRARMQGS